LVSIAESLASHDGLATVDDKHVDAAFNVLSEAGLRRQRWIDRPEAEAALGSFCIGFAFSCPDVVSVFFSEVFATNIAKILILAFFLLGVILFSHGTYRLRLPAPPQDASPKIIWTRRIGIATLIIVLALVAGMTIYARVFYQCENCIDDPITLETFEVPELAIPEQGGEENSDNP